MGFGLEWEHPEVSREFSDAEGAVILWLSESVNNALIIIVTTPFGYSIQAGGTPLDPEKYIPAYKSLSELGVLWAISTSASELSGKGFRLATALREKYGDTPPELQQFFEE